MTVFPKLFILDACWGPGYSSQKKPSISVLIKGVLKICSKFTGEHSCRSAISIKLPSNSNEITLRHGCSPVNLLHIFSTPFSKTTMEGCSWLLHNLKLNRSSTPTRELTNTKLALAISYCPLTLWSRPSKRFM